MNYLENGNIVNSVNYPNCEMGICVKESRITIYHKNIANMITKFTSVMGDAGINISDMNSKSRGEYAYTMLDLDSRADDAVLDKLGSTEGVIRVRVVK